MSDSKGFKCVTVVVGIGLKPFVNEKLNNTFKVV